MSRSLNRRLRPLIVVSSLFGVCFFGSSFALKIYAASIAILLTTACTLWFSELDITEYYLLLEGVLQTTMMIILPATGIFIILSSIFGSSIDGTTLGTTLKPPTWIKCLYPIILRAVLLIVAATTTMTMSPTGAIPTIKELFVFYISLCQTAILQLQYSAALQILSDQWQALTDTINRKPSRVEKIESILKEANRLHELSSMVSSVFSKQILVSLIRLIILNTAFLYLLTVELASHIPYKEFELLIKHSTNILIIMLTQSIELWSLLTSCENINIKSTQFNESLFTLAIEDRLYMISSMDCVKNHFAIMRTTAFTACGFISLNYTLLCYMTATVTTYLVVLLHSSPDIE